MQFPRKISVPLLGFYYFKCTGRSRREEDCISVPYRGLLFQIRRTRYEEIGSKGFRPLPGGYYFKYPKSLARKRLKIPRFRPLLGFYYFKSEYEDLEEQGKLFPSPTGELLFQISEEQTKEQPEEASVPYQGAIISN